jgi:hypothetical protein
MHHEIVGPLTHVIRLQDDGQDSKLHLNEPVGQWAGLEAQLDVEPLADLEIFAGTIGRIAVTVRDRLPASIDMALRSFSKHRRSGTPDI